MLLISQTPLQVGKDKKEKTLDLMGSLWRLRGQQDAITQLFGRLKREMEVDVEDSSEVLYALCSSLNLCIVLGTDRALAWADQLWQWSEEPGRIGAWEENVPKNSVAYSSYLQLEEMQGRFDSVNDVLMRVFVEEKIQANERMLVALLNLAAQRQDGNLGNEPRSCGTSWWRLGQAGGFLLRPPRINRGDVYDEQLMDGHRSCLY
eukprot:Skav224671  [mRNA]  locus=scaffold4044:117073:124098:- [translate_table: standard]